MSIPNIDPLRQGVQRDVGVEIPDAIWRYIQERDFFSPSEGFDYPRLVRETKALLDAAGVRPIDGASESEVADDTLGQTLGELLAQEAGLTPEVARFRQDCLDGAFIEPQDVEAWMEKIHAQEGGPTVYLTIPVEPPHKLIPQGRFFAVEPELRLSSLTEAGAVRIETRRISFLSPGSAQVRHLAVVHGGVLDRLRSLSEMLARRYPWRKAQASVYVLTGKPPQLSRLQTKLRFGSLGPAMTRIELEVDPSVLPKELAAQYAKLRKVVFGNRPRSVTDKHLTLVRFTARRPAGEPWLVRMRAWNQECPDDWKYKEVKNFARDCKQGLRRLMGEDATYPNKKVIAE